MKYVPRPTVTDHGRLPTARFGSGAHPPSEVARQTTQKLHRFPGMEHPGRPGSRRVEDPWQAPRRKLEMRENVCQVETHPRADARGSVASHVRPRAPPPAHGGCQLRVEQRVLRIGRADANHAPAMRVRSVSEADADVTHRTANPPEKHE